MFEGGLSMGADVAAVATAILALVAFAQFHLHRRARRKRLEEYLKTQKASPHKFSPQDQGQRTLIHLSARLGMTEPEIMDAAFRSRRIVRRISPDLLGNASALLLEYCDETGPPT